MNRRKLLLLLMGGKPEFIKGRFVLLVKSDNAGTSEDTEFTLTGGVGTNYPIDWFEKDNPSYNGSLVGNGAQTIDFGKVGEFYVQVGPPFNRIQFNNGGDRLKLLEINQWGDIVWSSFADAFRGCNNLDSIAGKIPAPKISSVTSMESMLRETIFNQDIGHWDVSNVTNMERVFQANSQFNQDINDWDVSNVTSMRFLMFGAGMFNHPVDKWDVSNITNMASMFRSSLAFNQSLETWSLNVAVDLDRMLESSNMSKENFSRTLIGFANDIHERGLADDSFDTTLGATGLEYDDTVYEGIGNGHFNKATDAVPFLALKGIALAGATDVS